MVGKSKAMKKRGKVGTGPEEETTPSSCSDPDVAAIPIENLPDDVLRMNVKCGTKIRNVLEYAITHFPRYPGVVWVGRADGINKTISCAEIFKRKHPGLHQITRIRFAKKMPENTTSNEKFCGDGSSKSNKIPEIFVALLRQVEDVNVDGYQAPDDTDDHREPGGDLEGEESSVVTQIDGQESATKASKAEKRRKMETEKEEEQNTSKTKVMRTSDS